MHNCLKFLDSKQTGIASTFQVTGYETQVKRNEKLESFGAEKNTRCYASSRVFEVKIKKHRLQRRETRL